MRQPFERRFLHLENARLGIRSDTGYAGGSTPFKQLPRHAGSVKHAGLARPSIRPHKVRSIRPRPRRSGRGLRVKGASVKVLRRRFRSVAPHFSTAPTGRNRPSNPVVFTHPREVKRLFHQTRYAGDQRVQLWPEPSAGGSSSRAQRRSSGLLPTRYKAALGDGGKGRFPLKPASFEPIAPSSSKLLSKTFLFSPR